MKLLILITATLASLSSFAGQIALTFDDAPRDDEKIYTGIQRTQKLIDVLGKHKIQAAFFVNTDKLAKSNGAERISAYSKAGHFIANHTHSHIRLTTNAKEFIVDFERADSLLKDYPTFKKWLRYPYLWEGADEENRDLVRAHLAAKGYRNGYVTIDNYDYFINNLVQGALKEKRSVRMDRACQMLIEIMWDGIKFYDGVAKEHIGPVRHVLLMHENDIEAYCLEDLIGHIKRQNWKIISPEEAFNDPLMREEPNTMYLSQGRVAAIAHVKTGTKYISKWETERELKAEFEKRKIIE